jgi:aryl-alcohol dehydrogenase-like predicted oxidoreductase
MKTRRLGASGPLISAIGIGAMSFTDFYGTTDESQSHAILAAALDEGVTHIDTSNVYGPHRSEAAIGSFLAKQGNQRGDLFSIATKAGITKDPDTGARIYNNSAAHLEAELDGSLARLGVERVDLFYVHRRDAATPIEEVTETLAGLIKKGKIGGFGYSEIAPSSLRRANAVHPVMAIQSEYSLAVRYPELGLVQTTAELGTALVAFSPVGRSLLTDKPHSPEKAAELPFLKVNPRFQEPNLSANIAAGEGFRNLAADMGTSAAALAIAWLLHQGEHVIPIPGTRSPEHLRQHCEGARLDLDDTALAAIEQVLPVGWAHGDRYSLAQWDGPERYC